MTHPAEPLSPPGQPDNLQSIGAPACPSCHLADQVQHVPAAYRAGRTAWSGVNNYGVHQQGATVTSTAAVLDPTVPRPPTAGLATCGIIGIMLGCAFALLTRAQAHEALFVTTLMDSHTEHLLLLVACIPALCGLALMAGAVSRARRSRSLDGLEQVVWHWWRYAWTCHRCGGVYFPPRADLPPTLYPGHLLNPVGFRRALWDTARASAGGRR